MVGAALEGRMHFPFTEKEVDMKTLLLAATLTLAVYVGTTGAQNPTGPHSPIVTIWTFVQLMRGSSP